MSPPNNHISADTTDNSKEKPMRPRVQPLEEVLSSIASAPVGFFDNVFVMSWEGQSPENIPGELRLQMFTEDEKPTEFNAGSCFFKKLVAVQTTKGIYALITTTDAHATRLCDSFIKCLNPEKLAWPAIGHARCLASAPAEATYGYLQTPEGVMLALPGMITANDEVSHQIADWQIAQTEENTPEEISLFAITNDGCAFFTNFLHKAIVKNDARLLSYNHIYIPEVNIRSGLIIPHNPRPQMIFATSRGLMQPDRKMVPGTEGKNISTVTAHTKENIVYFRSDQTIFSLPFDEKGNLGTDIRKISTVRLTECVDFNILAGNIVAANGKPGIILSGWDKGFGLTHRYRVIPITI